MLPEVYSEKRFGINKENIRYSIHYGMPASLEALYQEAGRCGRDGHKAENVVIFSNPMKIPNTILDGSNASQLFKTLLIPQLMRF